MPDRLMTLVNLMNGSLEYETGASAAQLERIRDEDADKPAAKRRKPPTGFVEGSDAHEAAALIGWPLVALGRGDEHMPAPPQGDLFSVAPEALAERYELDEAWLETAFPVDYGGAAPADRASEDTDAENGTALAWDADSVMLSCPRGCCVVDRERWGEGWRRCPGC